MSFFSFVKQFVSNSRRITAENLPPTNYAKEFKMQVPQEYRGLDVDCGFAKGNWAYVTWIDFLAQGQKTTNGIYPVYLYYREHDMLILAYGVSASAPPVQNWPGEHETIGALFNRLGKRLNGKPLSKKHYRDSMVYKVYDHDAIDKIDSDKDLDDLIDEYMAVMNINDISSISRGSIDDFQCIYFGCPGSGKSYRVKQIVEDKAKPEDIFRTTFHPDSDYSSFVGAYKPVKIEQNGDIRLTYEFVPQAFTDAYVAAWKDTSRPVYLVIEEINRGNCAQIFGDLFQLLDRDDNGVSEYGIKADRDLRDYLEGPDGLGVGHDGIKNGELRMPGNLHILATMNTSDQSLFPMDSAFKRRWSWVYVPIETSDRVKSKDFEINIDGDKYNWHEFLTAVNKKIVRVTESEDKQLGNFFIKKSVDKEEFKNKVMFYLWSEVCKDEFKHNSFFKYPVSDTQKEFSFNDLYPDGSEILKAFIPHVINSEKGD